MGNPIGLTYSHVKQHTFLHFKGYIMAPLLLRLESRPSILGYYIRIHGIKRAYWHLRDLGATRYSAIRSIFFSI